jgi:hypothetical protein
LAHTNLTALVAAILNKSWIAEAKIWARAQTVRTTARAMRHTSGGCEFVQFVARVAVTFVVAYTSAIQTGQAASRHTATRARVRLPSGVASTSVGCYAAAMITALSTNWSAEAAFVLRVAHVASAGVGRLAVTVFAVRARRLADVSRTFLITGVAFTDIG